MLNLTDEQRADLEACMGKFRVSVTPYYASLMDPDDPSCPVRMQGVPTPAELIVRPEDLKDAIAEDFDSPTPRITHRYPDRVLFMITEMCSMYCRHCTRRRIVGEHRGRRLPGRDRQRLHLHRAHARGARRAAQRRRPADPVRRQARGDPRPRAAIDHVEIVRIGSRMPVVCPQRITPELCAMLKKYHPLYLNTHFNHPKEITEESVRACAMLADAGIPLGNQTVLMRGINDCAKVMKRLVHKLVAVRVKPYYYYQCDLAEGTAHFRTCGGQGHRDLREPARPHDRLRRADLHHRRHRRRR